MVVGNRKYIRSNLSPRAGTHCMECRNVLPEIVGVQSGDLSKRARQTRV